MKTLLPSATLALCLAACVAPAPPPPPPGCNPSNCTGCCTASGACFVGSSEAACGVGAAQCQVCSATDLCAVGRCWHPAPDGGLQPTDGGTKPDAGWRPDGGDPKPDAGQGLKLGSWNVQYFGSDAGGPTDDALQLANAREVLARSAFDLVGLVEMANAETFEQLRAQLPGYDGFLSSDPRVNLGPAYYSAGELKLGVLYRPERFTLRSASLILTSYSYVFVGRPPMELRFGVVGATSASDFSLIVVHLKAQLGAMDTASWQQRKDAAAALKAYLDATHAQGRVFVVGDWNDDVDTSILDGYPTPFQALLDAPTEYTFITAPLSAAGVPSTAGYPAFIDHELVTRALLTDYQAGSATALRPDAYIANYRRSTSDHFPIQSTFSFSAPTPVASLKWLRPKGGETVEGFSSMTVQWTASNVSTVNIDLSVNGGASWTPVATAFPATPGTYCWRAPNVTASALLRISSNALPAVSDITGAINLVTRNSSAEILINEVFANENGLAPQREYVELVNLGAAEVDIGFWSLSDATALRHRFACETRVAPGKALVVFGAASGIPLGNPDGVAASTGSLDLDDVGDSVVLRINAATTEDTFSYGAGGVTDLSWNRSPDLIPLSTPVLHTSVPGASGGRSPGRKANGQQF